MVVTELLTNATLVRIIQPNGLVVNGEVRIDCVFQFDESVGTATADRLGAAADAA